MEDLSIEDRQAIEDFTAFLSGASACLICLMPTDECRQGDERCCPNCKHGRRVQAEGPAQSEFHARPSLLVKARVADDDGDRP
jgi:hypothetical protein